MRRNKKDIETQIATLASAIAQIEQRLDAMSPPVKRKRIVDEQQPPQPSTWNEWKEYCDEESF